MTARGSRLPDLLDHLKANLDARLAALAVSASDPTLAAVVVSTAPLRIDEAFESIEFGDADSDQDWSAIGNKPREERGSLTDCAIWIVRAGAGEETITAARDRAFALLDVVAQELRENVGQWLTSQQADSAVRVAAIRNIRLRQGALPSGRVATILFSIDYTVRLPA